MRAWRPSKNTLIAAVAVAMSLFHLYTGAFGLFDVPIQSGVHLAFAMTLILLVKPTPPPFAGIGGRALALTYDGLVAAATAAPLWYRFQFIDYLTSGRFEFVTPLTPLEIVLGLAFVFAVLDLCRRETGWPLVTIIVIMLIFPNVPHLPGVLNHEGYSLGIQVDAQYMTLAGIFGIPLSASANYITLFIIFGAFLERSGLGAFVIDFAVGLVGSFRGGPAKVAVIASAFHGTISGSAPANVLTVGPITIPMMKRLGFPAYMAGAIEAAASTGGVIMPPVMGSVAFIMAQFMGVSYSTVALYALIPAVLYFFGVFCTVHWSAVRHGIRGLDASEMPDWKRSLRERGHLFLPVILLVTLMSLDYSPQYCAGYAIIAVVVVSWLRPSTRMGPKAILAALEVGAKGAILVAVATAA